ncbi:MAG: AmmeMemoRadiSam system protein B [Deltaproteobacteria bacterium]|nr:AmmeMemoRadiSam system protein B [Deltaproteobacteria bacterium]
MKILRLNLILLVIIFCFAAACQATKVADADIREPAVAGKFYSESAVKLNGAIEKFMQDAVPVKVKKPVAIIVPHAGYIYSGQICADGFKQAANQQYDVIVILGTRHTNSDFQKISLYPGDGFRTPLGTTPVAKNIISSLLKEDPADCALDKSLHQSEHSVEVMVPFIQVVFPQAKIVPVVVGSQDMQTCIRFGQALAKVLKNKQALIIASSDLSHYPDAKDAKIVDGETLAAITKLDPAAFRATLQTHRDKNIHSLYTSACGEAPIMAAMAAAKSSGATRGEVISYANSGDTSIGEPSRVVGYGAVVLTADNGRKNPGVSIQQKPAITSATLTPADKKALLSFARETISRLFLTDTVPLARGFSENLEHPRGVFVTLRKNGELRGCIGQIIGTEPLVKLVGAMAIQAAFNDRRFEPLTYDELKNVEIEISVLTPMKQVSGASDIVVGRDGVVIRKEGHSAVFLPQVATEQGWNREEMLDNLCRKSGLDTGCWREKTQFSTFQAVVFSESRYK